MSPSASTKTPAERTVSAADAVGRFRTGDSDAPTVITAMRASVLIMPVTDRDQVLLARSSGLDWLMVFTSEEELARFARERREGDQIWQYVYIRGFRVLGPVVAALPAPCGVAVDVASLHALLLPPPLWSPVPGSLSDRIAGSDRAGPGGPADQGSADCGGRHAR